MALYTNMAFKQTQGPTPHKYMYASSFNGQLVYHVDGVVQPEAKFAIEHESGTMVHIRSCSNNKYVVRLHDVQYNENALGAKAVKKVVDRTSPGCTLFSIRMDNDNKTATLYHVQTGRVVRISRDNPKYVNVDPLAPTEAVSAVVDYDALVTLPKFVAFKGSNGLYYKNFANGGYSSFVEKEIGNPNIVCETHYSTDGHLMIEAHPTSSDGRATFWHTSNNAGPALVAYSQDTPPSVGQMFDIIKVSGNVIALRSRVNNLICMRADYADSASPKDRLVAKSDGMVNDAKLEIIEPVYNRTVNVYEFDLDRARIYGVELLYSDSHIWDNYTDVTQNGSADGRITTSKSHTFTNTISVSATVTTSFETGIPFIAEAKIEISATAGYSHQWAETTTDTQEVGHIFNVVIPPMKRTIARGTATKGKCDVPFAYTQRDYPTDGGPPRVTTLHDGVFTGANAYSFHSELRYDALPTPLGPVPTTCIKSIEPYKG